MEYLKSPTEYRFSIFIISISVLLIFSNCENYDANLDSNNQTNFINKVKLTDATIQIESKSALKSIIKSYQNSIEGQNYFNNKIKNL